MDYEVGAPTQRAAVHVHVGEPREIHLSHDDGPTTRIVWPLA